MTRTRTNGVEIETRHKGGLFISQDDGGHTRTLDEDEVDALREYLKEHDAATREDTLTRGVDVRSWVDPGPTPGPVPHDYYVNSPTFTAIQWDGTDSGAVAVARFVPSFFTVNLTVFVVPKNLTVMYPNLTTLVRMNPGDYLWFTGDPIGAYVASADEFSSRYEARP